MTQPAPDFVTLLLERIGRTPSPEDAVEALVPEIVDLAQIFVSVGDQFRLVAYRHIDPEFHPVLEELALVHRPATDHPSDPIAHVVRTGKPRLSRWVQRHDVERATLDGRVHAIFDTLQPRNIIVVPLCRDVECYGAIVVAVSSSSRRFVDADLMFMTSLADKLGPILRTS